MFKLNAIFIRDTILRDFASFYESHVFHQGEVVPVLIEDVGIRFLDKNAEAYSPPYSIDDMSKSIKLIPLEEE